MKSKFTLIELIATIVVLGILAAIVMVNIADQKEQAIKAEVISNTRNLQTAVDMYAMKHNGTLPSKTQPTIGNPQKVNFDILYPDYIRDEKAKHGYYWIDFEGQVWGSTVDAPQELVYETDSLSFKSVVDATAYEIFGYGDVSPVTGASNKKDYHSLEKVIPSKSSKIVSYKLPSNKVNDMYLVSAFDRFELPTPPVGYNYDGYNTIFPISEDFSLVTNANGKAIWEGLYTVESKPVGTSIEYSFQTSNDGNTYSIPATDMSTLPQSQYLKVNVKMNGANGKFPTIHKLHVKFRLVGEEFTEIDLINNQTKSENTIIVSDELKIIDNQNKGSSEHVIQLPSDKYVGDVLIIGEIPYGGSIHTEYSSSTDGVNWTTPVFHPEELPKGSYVKIINDFERSQDGYSPVIDRIILIPSIENPNTSDNSSATPAPQTSSWQTVSSFEIIEDASQVGDWISVEVVEDKPANTQILYKYYSSNDNITWSGPYTSVDMAPNSRYFKVSIEYQKKPEATANPKLKQITINYKLQDGSSKSVTRDVQPDGSTIIVQPSQGGDGSGSTGDTSDPTGVAVLVPLNDTLTCTNDLQGSGTISDPYLIHNANEVNAMRHCLTASYKLMNNIDMSPYGSTYHNGRGWVPIGGQTGQLSVPSFSGTLDGNNHFLTNLYVNDDPYALGLFGDTSNATIKNLTIKNAESQGTIHIGILAGRLFSTTVENVTVEGTVSVEQTSAGLLAGSGSFNTLTNVKAIGSVKSITSPYKSGGIGGLIGDTSSTDITNATANVDIILNGSGGQYFEMVGGLVGHLDLQSNLTKGVATGSLSISNTASSYTTQVGGLVGYAETSDIYNSYTTVTMNVSKTANVGGIVGVLERGDISNSYAQNSISGSNLSNVGAGIGRLVDSTSRVNNVYAATSISYPTAYNIGGLLGSNSTGFPSGTVLNSYWDATLTGNTTSTEGGTAKLTSELKQASTFTGWSTGIWNIQNGEYPTLK